MHLQQGTLLQGGKYRIEKVLGQGGFGITYLAIQIGLGRKVAVKEFFMKEHCDRNVSTNIVNVGSTHGKEIVKIYRSKFTSEARKLAALNHPNIINVIDVFEENNTAYYVMAFAEGGSMHKKVHDIGFLAEPFAMRYILQVASALEYIHSKKISHLDIKPQNIVIDERDEALIIDFGLAKQYDASSGDQTSSTPVGISEGYAPVEQYMKKGVSEFSPQTDVYALGATLFFMLTGSVPPNAEYIQDKGLPIESLIQKNISLPTINCIKKAMDPHRSTRIKNIAEFVGLLNANIPFESTNDRKTEYVVDVEEDTITLNSTLAPEHSIEDNIVPLTDSSVPSATSSSNTSKCDDEKRICSKVQLAGRIKKRRTWLIIAIVAMIALIVSISICLEGKRTEVDTRFLRACELYDSLQFDKSIPMFKELADEGNPEAMFRMARIHEEGWVIGNDTFKVDKRKTFEYYKSAADKGDLPAKVELATCYCEGIGTAYDWSLAQSMFDEVFKELDTKVSSDSSGVRPIELTYLGVCYTLGKGTDIDMEKALKYLISAANRGENYSMGLLSFIYSTGLWGGKSESESAKWKKMAIEYGNINEILFYSDNPQDELAITKRFANLGYAPSMLKLGEMYSVGNGVYQSDAEAIAWFKKAYEIGNAEAVLNLLEIYLDDGPEHSEPEAIALMNNVEESEDIDAMFYISSYFELDEESDSDVIKWINKSIKLGDPNAMYRLGEMYEQGKGVPESSEEAYKWFKQASDLGYGLATCKIGNMYYLDSESDSISIFTKQKNVDAAQKWYKKAAEQGNSLAMRYIGCMYFNGEGVEQSDEEAFRWIKQAANNREPISQELLGDMYYDGKGTEQSYQNALKWYMCVCTKFKTTYRKIGYMYKNGIGVGKTVETAGKWEKEIEKCKNVIYIDRTLPYIKENFGPMVEDRQQQTLSDVPVNSKADTNSRTALQTDDIASDVSSTPIHKDTISVSCDEKIRVDNAISFFFQAINSKDAGKIGSKVSQPMERFLNIANATAADVVAFAQKLSENTVNYNWRLDHNSFKIIKADNGKGSFVYYVSLKATLSKNTVSGNFQQTYNVDAKVKDGRVIALIMQKNSNSSYFKENM